MSTEVAEQYEALAGWFDANRNKSLIERPYLERILAHVQPREGQRRVLDLGCGTGEPMAAFFIAHGFHVTGVDIAQAMVEKAKTRFPQHDWHVGDIRKLDIAGRFDVVLAWDSFFHLSRDAQRAMFPVFARYAQTGAMLLLNTGGEDGEMHSKMEGLSFHYASLSTAEYQSLLEKAGFTTIVHTSNDQACGGRTIWLAQKN